MLRGRASVVAAVMSLAACEQPSVRAQLAPPVEVRVPTVPRPVDGDGRTHLVYELHITNLGRRPITIREIAVGSSNAATGLATFSGDELRGMIRRPGMDPDVDDPERIDAGMRAVAFVWVTLDSAAVVPDRLTHRITLVDDDDAIAVLDAPGITVGPPAVVIGPPLRGHNWFAANGPNNMTGHRRAMITLEGRPWIAQRFAIDWVQVRDNVTHAGDPEDNSSYYAWGQDVLAVADGIVASTHDSIPENVPGPTSRAVPITLETIGGNYVILDIGNGHFAFYAHLRPGSLRVAPGDSVHRGDVLGLVGNSGNSTGPHLHFHMGDRNSPLASEGLPWVIDEFQLQGSGPSLGSVLDLLDPPQTRTRQLPMANELVRFSTADSTSR